MAFKLHQAIIQQYNNSTLPRTCNVMQIPEHYPLVNVRLPQILKDQSIPGVGSLVLVASEDSYKHYIVCVLRESSNFVDKDGYLRGSTAATSQALQPGEIFMEAYGDPQAGVPGTGPFMYLGNNGVAWVSSGQTSEYLMVGGKDDDDDHEVILNGDNGFIQSNPNPVTMIQSILQWDSLNNIQLGNNVLTGASFAEIPNCELTMDAVGNVVLRNTSAGVTKSQLKMDILGNVTLANLTASLTFTPAGAITITGAATGTIKVTGALAVNGSTVNINNGTLGAARLNDFTVSNTTLDPTFWTFITGLQAFFTALSGFTGGSPVAHSELGALGLAFLATSPVVPAQQVGKINSASSSVKIGN